MVNNLVNSTVSIPTNSMVSTAIMNEDASMKVASLVNNLVSSTVSIPSSSMVSTAIMNEDASMKVW